MNLVVATSSISQMRLDGFLEELSRARPSSPLKIIVADTCGSLQANNYPAVCLTKARPHLPFRYSCDVAYERVKAAKEHCDEDSILFFFDDDYALNPYTLDFADHIFSKSPQVNFLSLLRGVGIPADYPSEELCGVRFSRQPMQMGGSMIVRWKIFYPLVEAFFKQYRIDGRSNYNTWGFDIVFWQYLLEEHGIELPVWMIMDFTLTQHCNFGSHYESERLGQHSYGEGFDPRMNPLLRIRE